MTAKSYELGVAGVPLAWVGPMKVMAGGAEGAVLFEGKVPLATYESPLWPSVERGARATGRAGGIVAVCEGACMTRSVILEATDAAGAAALARFVEGAQEQLAAVTAGTSRFARLREVRCETVGRLVFARFSLETGDASGHNMATKAAEAMLNWILERRRDAAYGSISGNLCCDKKVSAVNGLLGRGKRVVAEAVLGRELVARFLKTTPERLERLCWEKNWVGSTLAGSLRSANAHAANMLLAFYLATGQDAANIVEGSQCFTLAETTAAGDLRFSCTLPNLIVGTTGNGKDLPFVQENLARLGCAEAGREPGENARKLACICAATVLCGELSLLAAEANPGELMQTHVRMERGTGTAKG
ncbi:MAG: hydroxymethylglutaryl-CoA reductase [Kiritimatiellae bacterium]|nr:hydroxymethylglutaryl-CoA reductase [Kiritimatiellia bacterium]